MLPPSDSFAHQNLKLAEVLASLQKQTAAAPPPPYAATATTATPELLGEFEDDEEDDSTSVAPIVIKIDTSISIDGQNNTVAIPTASEDSQSDVQNSAPSIQQLQQLQQRRQAKSAQLASAIILALKSASVLDDIETGRQRPIEIEVNAGIRITGNSNMVCPGARKRAGSDLALGQLDRKRRAQSEPLEIPERKRVLTTKESAST
ncbi:hypothetical protein MGYG_01883 [Nannizzia gypsea CBS 118893]|uniref:Uncharacterized protein n=1 Tax=Arthroderma gypseum (strain ATCC MYA-4604 / CBS 118893) TaxID=535722 RepID=E5QYK5_ARTGP|nr:hypothetical protein MGYG_01883 [Nannizzia gypsea CBS 118893]EFQ98868.1 hypothetical protein MGYG_01883 [Nannizzia gypsea CBS 118893]